MFQVVAVDETVVDIQDVDGDVDEIELDAWFAMPLVGVEAPEDSRGPVDGDEADAFGDDADPAELMGRGWRAPLDDLPAQPQEAIEADEADEERPAP
jgi:hypothetical protein